MSKTGFFKSYRSIVGFLILEIMALVSFTFANINEILYLIATVLSIVAFVFAFFTNVDRKDFVKLAPIVGGLFIISGIAAFGGFSHQCSTLSNIATFFAIPSFFSLGFFARRLGKMKMEHVILAIGFGLAAITLIGTIITWIQYGPFYAAIYKNTPTYFYEGTAYNVTKEMGWLMGFKITEVAVEYGGLFAILCAVFLPALLFIKVKEEKKLFICSAVIGGIGLISILSVPNWKALIFLAIASIFAFIYKFLKERKRLIKGISIGVLAIIGVGVLFFVLTIINAGVGFKFPGFLNKIMVDNSFMKAAANTLSAAFAKDNNGYLFTLLGYDINNQTAPLIGEYGLKAIVFEPTLIFEYEIIKEVGIIGTFFVLVFFIAMVVFVIRYIKDAKDSSFLKNVVVMMILAFILYSTLSYNIQTQPQHQDIYGAFLRSAPFMVLLFLFGFTYFVPDKVKDESNEKVEDVSL